MQRLCCRSGRVLSSSVSLKQLVRFHLPQRAPLPWPEQASVSSRHAEVCHKSAERPSTSRVPSAANEDFPKIDSCWVASRTSLRDLPNLYLQLAKARLTALVTLTAAAGYVAAPDVFCASSFVGCVVGTALLSACANTLNQFIEAPYDAQMKRTQARVLVRRALSPPHALGFAATAGASGAACLCVLANPLAACLGVLNALLYAGAYTPLKRASISCTWAGALVGAIPPLMGWAACTAGLDGAALVLAAMLFAWQFPHFNSLSWNLRADYAKAGYRVMCVTNPRLCRVTTLRYSVALLALCSVAAPMSSLMPWSFSALTLPLNAYMVFLSWKFYSRPDSRSSRKLFMFSLLYLPCVMLIVTVGSFGFVGDRQIDH